MTFNELTPDQQDGIIELVETFARRVTEISGVLPSDADCWRLIEYAGMYPDVRDNLEELSRCRIVSTWALCNRQFDRLLSFYDEYHSLSLMGDAIEYEETL
jgi:hypothetical protein